MLRLEIVFFSISFIDYCMRKCLYILFAFLFLIALALMVNGASSTFPLLGKTIILDAGHGGKDGGAEVGSIKEKDINLRVVMSLKDALEEKGANVILTRTSDDDLSEDGVSRRKKSDFDKRIEIINTTNPDIYLSIHQNIFESSKYRGSQVFYVSKNSYNKRLAEVIQSELNFFTKTNRKIKEMHGKYMYARLNPNGVLIECGFLSNYFDRTNLMNDDYVRKLSLRITQGIINYFYS